VRGAASVAGARSGKGCRGRAPRRSFCFSPVTPNEHADNEAKRNYPTAARRNIVSSKAPSAVPVERGASYT